jgi:hypothetical protein
MHNVCFATKKCPHPFFAERFQRLVECCLIGRKEIIPNCGRACFIDHFKSPVGRFKPIDVDANFSAVFSNSTRQSRLNEFWIAHTISSAHQHIPEPPYPIQRVHKGLVAGSSPAPPNFEGQPLEGAIRYVPYYFPTGSTTLR